MELNESDEELLTGYEFGSTLPAKITFDDAIENLGFGLYQWIFLILSGVTWSFDAIFTLSSSLMLPLIIDAYVDSPILEGALLSSFFFGSLFGAILFGLMADTFGRRYGFLATSLLTLVPANIAVLSGSIYILPFCLLLIGMGVGSAAVCFTYFAEMIPAGKRGMVLIFFESFWGFGDIYEVLLAWIILRDASDWRIFFYITSIPMIGIVFLWVFIPETARFLHEKGKVKMAKKGLLRIEWMNNLPRRLFFLKEVAICEKRDFQLIEKEVESTNKSFKDRIGNSLELFKVLFSKKYIVTTLLLSVIWFMNTFIYYGFVFLTPIFNFTGGSRNANYLFILLTTVAELPGLLAAFILIELIGRRWTQTLCFFICGVSTAGLFLHNFSVVPDFVVLLFVFISRASIVAAFDTAYIYTPEIYPTKVRSSALGIFNSLSRLSGIIAPVTPYLFRGNVAVSITLYSVLSFVASLCAAMTSIKTKGVKLDNV